jgi:PAS domain S-box-containing protein
MDTDRNLLFGVLALQTDLIDPSQFVEACALWATRKTTALPDLLVEKGWITAEDRADLQRLVDRKLKKHGGDARAGLAAVADPEVHRSLAALGDAEIHRTLADLRPPARPDQAATVDHTPGPGERYTLTRLHATGGIGRVWLAHDGNLGRDVALKELRPERAEHATLGARFLQEAQITGQLEHPGIIPVYELVRARDGRQPFYTMRFVRGRTLSEAARAYHQERLAGQADPLGLPALLNAFVTVCNTVAYAHSRGVIHRDLKGQNVILGDFGEVVVLDWGLAKRVGWAEGEAAAASVVLDERSADSGYTVQGQALGTPAYMAPEQAEGRLDQIDRRTDVYGLGAILYEILTGAPPFSGDSTQEVMRKVCEETPAPPRQLWPEAPAALEALCLRALAKRPEDRPSAAADLAREVQGWQEFERRKAEEALRESEALYHSLVESLPCSVWRKGLDGRFTFANQHFCDLFGGTLEQLVGKDDFDIGPRELAEKYRRDDQRVIATGGTFEDIEEQLSVGVQGDRYVHTLKTAVRDAGGNIIGTQGLAWDVTARKLAEEELRKSRERFELAVLASQDGLWDWDVEHDQVWYSARMREMLGYDEQEFPNRPGETEKRVHPDDHARWRAVLHGHVTGATDHLEMEYRILHKDGSYRWVRDRGVALRRADGKAYRIAGSREDVTARKRFEEELTHERYLLRTIMDTVPDKIYFKDRDNRFIRVNKDLAENFGLADAADAVGKSDSDFFMQEHAQQARTDECEIVRTGRPIVAKEEREIWLRDGRVTWASTTKLPLRDPQGSIIGTFGISRDITERKQAEEALARERDLLAALMDNLPDGIYFKDPAGRFLRVNQAVADSFGVSDPSNVVGKTDRDFFTEEYAGATAAAEQAILQTGHPLVGVEEKVTFRDGRVEWVSTTKLPLRDKDGNIVGTFGVSRNISARKRAEDEVTRLRQRAAERT